MDPSLSHLNAEGLPEMVDVSGKQITLRTAQARSRVEFPEAVFATLSAGDFVTSKGSLLQTAILAGTMAAKRTSELIPLCHLLALSKVEVKISPDHNALVIDTFVKCEGKTGVEMEALMAASIAALTIYDMCKALSHDLCISQTQLISKHGGKQDFVR
jgi:cyclic pyranopterin phosphate synthase